MDDAPGDHLTRDGLAALLAGTLGRERTRALVAHLLGGCAACRAQLRGRVALGAPAAPGAAAVDPYELPFARAYARAREEAGRLAASRLEASLELAAMLTGHPGQAEPASSPPERWAWCEALLATAAALRRHDPDEALYYAELARVAAERLAGGPYPAAALADLEAQVYLEIGNLLRIHEQLDGAEEAFGTAQARLAAGTGDPRLAARLCDLLGSLYRDQRHFGEALEVLDLAAHAYRRCGERHLAGRSLLKAGIVPLYAGEPEKALQCFERAAGLVDPRRDPALFLSVVHNLLLAQAEAGQAEQAARMLWQVRPLYAKHGSAADRIRLLGLEAKIALGQGQLARAERLFRRAKAGFEQAGQPYVASVVALELAAVLLDLGRPGEVLALVDETLGVFWEMRIEREAILAVLVLHKALLQGEATAALARQVAADLRRLDLRPPAPREGRG